MVATQLQLYNGALHICRETKLADLTENREARYLLDDVWADNAINYCLEQGLWEFALRTASFTADPDYVASFGFQNRFEKPADWIRTNGVCIDDRGSIPITAISDEGGSWFCDTTPIYVQYVSNDPLYGGNMGAWPATFVLFFEHYLALRIAPQLSSAKELVDDIEAMYKRVKLDAQSKAAMNESAMFPPMGSWVRARIYRGTLVDRGNTNQLIG